MQLGSIIKERRKRKGWSQTVLGDLVGMSAATIHRIEHGEKIPPDDELNLFADALTLDAQQLILQAEEDRQTLKNNLVPSTSYQTRWEYAHPADYSGRIWIQVHPQSNIAEKINIVIQWGAWEYKGTIEKLTAKSITLWHYKFNDGLGLPMIITLSSPCYLVFGKDTPPQKPIIDIINQWYRTQPMSFMQMVHYIVNFLSIYITWHLSNLANPKSE